MKLIIHVTVLQLALATSLFASCDSNNQKTYDRIHKHLDAGFALTNGGTVASAIEYARAQAVSARNEGTPEEQIAARNAEYFLHGLYAMTSEDLEAQFWIKTTPELYDLMKYALHELRNSGFVWVDSFFRDNPYAPVSPPGGAEWARRGIEAGAVLPGATKHSKSKEHGLSIPCRKNSARKSGPSDFDRDRDNDGFFDTEMKDKIDNVNERNSNTPLTSVEIIDEFDSRYGTDFLNDECDGRPRCTSEQLNIIEDDAPGGFSMMDCCY